MLLMENQKEKKSGEPLFGNMDWAAYVLAISLTGAKAAADN